MIKKNCYYVMGLLILLSVFGCEQAKKDPVKDDFIRYMDTIFILAKIEDEALMAFDSVSGDRYTSDEAMYKALNEVAYPKMKEFLKKMESVHPVTNEVSGIHRLYLEKIRLHVNAYVFYKEALEKKDKSRIEKGMELIQKKDLLYQKWLLKLDHIKKRYAQ